ncbi:MAG: response regulator, partial [Alphaproteobacteria bacterium]
MPKGSGKELVSWIRNHEAPDVHFLPIIIVSGYTTEKLTHKTRDLGVNEILVKPISGKLLASRICSVIDQPRPFIKSVDYFGPDRRRQDIPLTGTDRRINSPRIVERDA